MRKIKRKIILMALLLLTIISLFYSSFAFEIGEKSLVSLGECERYLTYNGNPVKTTYIALEKDGRHYPAYCLDVTKPGIETTSYTVNGGSKIQDINVWRAVINGYPYKSVQELGAANEQEAFTATKHAVYTLLYNRDTSSYGAVDSESGRRVYQIYLNIVNNARNSSENIINNPEVNISVEDDEWKIDEKESGCVSKTYSLESNVPVGNYKIELEGNVPEETKITDLNNNEKNEFSIGEKFKVLMPIQKMLKDDSFNICATANLETKPVVYGTTNLPGTQDYAITGYMFEQSNTKTTENYLKNMTKLKIIKKEYGTEKKLEGVKFNILNSNKDVIIENVVTDENGEIILENMLPGTYYIQEVECLDDYNLYTDLSEIDLDFNEEYEFTLNNVLKEVKEQEKSFEIVEVVPSYEVQKYQVSNVKKLPVTGF